RADAIRAALPAGLLQQLVGFLDVEFPACVLRSELWRVVDEIARRDAGPPINVLFDRFSVDQKCERLPDRGIAEQRMLRLGARALAFDVGPGIGVVDLDMLDIAARKYLRTAARLTAFFQADEDLVLNLHVPGIIVFASLNDGTGRRYR